MYILYMYMYIYIYIHTHIYIYIHMLYTYTNVYIYIYIYTVYIKIVCILDNMPWQSLAPPALGNQRSPGNPRSVLGHVPRGSFGCRLTASSMGVMVYQDRIGFNNLTCHFRIK